HHLLHHARRRGRIRRRAPEGFPGGRHDPAGPGRRHVPPSRRPGRRTRPAMSPDQLPIGIFDSGIGGLTVVRELVRHLPNESILYFGDTARVPNGSKAPETVARYSEEAAAFLTGRGVKAVVIACNTATAHAGELLRRSLDVPVVGVIEPGSRAAAAATRTSRVGLIGTAGTIRSGAYDLAVRRKLEDARVYAQACPLF